MSLDEKPEAAEVSDSDAELLLQAFKSLTGITIPIQKKTMIMFRLRKRLAELGHPSVAEYTAKVRHSLREQQIFINLLTTNETSFFRTPRVWTYFREEFLPQAVKTMQNDTLKVWSAAASTGEEACSIAMLCHDLQLRHPSFRYQVLATDVDTDVLARAESGRFCSRTVDKLRQTNPDLFGRHFKESAGDSFEADQQLLRNIRFAPHNLMESSNRWPSQHLVFLRNVLIYFREAEQIKILKNLSTIMAPGSILILGESESISALNTPFRFEQPQIYSRAS